MIYAYIRVSTDKQSVENQRYEIETFCRKKNFAVERWIEETISSRVSLQERKLGKLLKRIKRGDTLIVSELSRLGRSLMEIMGILNTLGGGKTDNRKRKLRIGRQYKFKSACIRLRPVRRGGKNVDFGKNARSSRSEESRRHKIRSPQGEKQ